MDDDWSNKTRYPYPARASWWTRHKFDVLVYTAAFFWALSLAFGLIVKLMEP
jgi:hypothetical protein